MPCPILFNDGLVSYKSKITPFNNANSVQLKMDCGFHPLMSLWHVIRKASSLFKTCVQADFLQLLMVFFSPSQAYNIHVNGVLHCRVRYSQLLGLHEQVTNS